MGVPAPAHTSTDNCHRRDTWRQLCGRSFPFNDPKSSRFKDARPFAMWFGVRVSLWINRCASDPISHQPIASITLGNISGSIKSFKHCAFFSVLAHFHHASHCCKSFCLKLLLLVKYRTVALLPPIFVKKLSPEMMNPSVCLCFVRTFWDKVWTGWNVVSQARITLFCMLTPRFQITFPVNQS